MFLALGAYGAAVIAGVLGIRHFEIVLLGAGLGAVVVALPVGFLCVRYTGIFFGMLTLAFGMLVHSFLFKFYHLTGGDSGMRVPRMRILGLEFEAYNKIELLAGPFYYYCLALLVLAGLPHVAHRAFAVRPALALAARQRAEGRVPGRARARCSAWRRSSSPRSTARSAAPSSASASASPTPSWCTGRTRAISCS